jgi:hypothetical protein
VKHPLVKHPLVKHPVVKSGERGYALLIVFLLAAAIALMLYQQMPRVAFESERDKEQLLIDRGEQYKRAIQLYMVANKRYPARIEDLENTNDKRFLRKRYIDPFTGKNEWRLVHTNGMFLTDSLVQKPPTAPADGKSTDLSVSSNTTTASSTNSSSTTASSTPGVPTPPDVNATVLQRPSDRTLPVGAPGQYNPAQSNPYQSSDPNQVGVGPNQTAFPPITLSQIQNTLQGGTPLPGGIPGATQQNLPGCPPSQLPGQTGTGQAPLQGSTDPSQQNPCQPVQVQPGQFQPGQLQPGQFPPGQVPPGQFQPGQFQPGQVQPGQFQQGQFQPGQGQGGAQSGVPGQPGTGPAGAPNNAINLINQLLTTPRTPPAGVGAPASNNTVGGGIAGVASTYTGTAIKSYNTRTKFNEWEFVFQNQQQGAPGQTGQPTNGTNPQGQGQQTGTGTPPPAPTSPSSQ